MKSPGVERVADHHSQPGDDLVAGDRGHDEVGARRALSLRLRERRGDDRDADVGDRPGVSVVVVERVAGDAVDQRGIGRRKAVGYPDRGRRSARPDLGHRLAGGRSGVERVRGQAAAEHVEDVELLGLDDVLRDRVERQRRAEGGETLGCGIHGLPLRLSSRCRWSGTCR